MSNVDAANDVPGAVDSRVVVLTVDRLGTGFLGPYGNTWIETPGANRLASESLLLENFFVETNDPGSFIHSVLSGVHAAQQNAIELADEKESGNLAELLRSRNDASLLITDDPDLSESEPAGLFDEVLSVELPGELRRAKEIEETVLGRLFAGAIQAIEHDCQATLIWIHSSGLNSAWDAPLELRNQFADEEDPDPPELLQPPSLLLAADHDPDELTGIGFAYAGQVAVLDYCLAALHDCITRIPEEHRPMLLFSGTRGFPLGEHRAIGDAATGLYEELIHVPLMVRFPDGQHALERLHGIAQPCDLYALLRSWLCDGGSSPLDQSFDRFTRLDASDRYAYVFDLQQIALRNDDWYLICRNDGSAQPELYAKPDDRWEVNEVADRCREVSRELEETLRTATSDAEHGKLNRSLKSEA